MNSIERDRALIADLGGPSKVAELMEFPKEGGAQRVQNWLSRGIPAQVKLDRPDLFLRHLQPKQPPALANAAQGAMESVAAGAAQGV